MNHLEVMPLAAPSAPLAELRKVWAYMKKEFLIEMSYRFAFVFSIFGISTSIATYFFIDRLFGRQMTPDLAPFGAPYFAYVLVGNAFFAYVGTAVGGISGRIAAEQVRGTLEVLFATPSRLWVLILAMAIWNTLYASAEVVIYFFVGGIGFGVDFSRINWSALASVLGLVIVAFNSIGLTQAAWMLVFKRGTVVAWVFNGVWALLGGVFFPVTVLPSWLQHISAWIPITHAIRGLQLAIYQGTPVTQLARELWMLGLFCVLLLPLGLLSWDWALRRARVEGSLSLH
ncbi:MAG: ABC transporter permease [Candidatus Methylomirabilia bacterium]